MCATDINVANLLRASDFYYYYYYYSNILTDGCSYFAANQRGCDYTILAVCLSVNYAVSYFGIPFISQVCTDGTLTNKNYFNTFMRIGGTYTTLGTGIVSIFKLYGWDLVAIIASSAGICGFTTSSVTKVFAQTNITVAIIITIFDTDGPTQMAQYLSLARTQARSACTNLILNA